MLLAISLHLLVGLGALACQTCGQKLCRHTAARWLLISVMLLAEATASVMLIDSMGLE